MSKLEEAIRVGEQSADRAIGYGLKLTVMRRRVRAALVMLQQGRPDTAKRILGQALLADDGKEVKAREVDWYATGSGE